MPAGASQLPARPRERLGQSDLGFSFIPFALWTALCLQQRTGVVGGGVCGDVGKIRNEVITPSFHPPHQILKGGASCAHFIKEKSMAGDAPLKYNPAGPLPFCQKGGELTWLHKTQLSARR